MKNTKKRPLRYSILIFIIITSIIMFNCSETSKIFDSQTPDKTISTLEYIQLNGVKQCLLIRSYNTDNPIILYIHGGPGTSELPLIRKYNSELEKHFTVVYWEQRGTGKSFNKNIPDSTYTIDQFVKDGFELSKIIIERFHQDKIYIMGHSWGTIISTKLAINHPKLYYAYIGIGQVVDMKRGEELSYKFALQKAIDTGNKKAIKALRQINAPTYLTINNNENWYKQLKTERKWVTYFGGVIYNQKDYSQLTKIYLKSSEYSLFDMIRFARGSVFSLKKLWPEIMKINLMKKYIEFKIPVYLIQGKHDHNNPTELVYEYYNKIIVPEKKLFIFDKSAHNPNFEENIKFNNLIEKIINKNE